MSGVRLLTFLSHGTPFRICFILIFLLLSEKIPKSSFVSLNRLHKQWNFHHLAHMFIILLFTNFLTHGFSRLNLIDVLLWKLTSLLLTSHRNLRQFLLKLRNSLFQNSRNCDTLPRFNDFISIWYTLLLFSVNEKLWIVIICLERRQVTVETTDLTWFNFKSFLYKNF